MAHGGTGLTHQAGACRIFWATACACVSPSAFSLNSASMQDGNQSATLSICSKSKKICSMQQFRSHLKPSARAYNSIHRAATPLYISLAAEPQPEP
jgi:hypothetical protein